MGVVGQQDLWVTGSRFYFVRDGDANATLYDMGTVDTANPQFNNQVIEALDGDGGILKQIDEALIRQTESYDLATLNCSLDNLAAFYLSAVPETFTQPSGGSIAAVPHKVVLGPGRMCKLKDSAGNWLYNVATVVVKAVGGGTTYVADTDYKIISLPRGIIQFLDASALSEGDTVEITVTLTALTGKRLVRPQTAGAAIKGKGVIVFGRGGNAQQTVREFSMSLTPSAANFQTTDYSKLTFSVKVLSDVTEATYPAGRILQMYGSIPATP